MARLTLAIAACTLLAPAARAADAPPDPLRCVPSTAGLVFKVENPRQLVEGVAKLDAYRNLRQFPQVREVFDSTPVRRFFQVVAHLETQVGAKWPDLLDKLAGGGIALGVGIGKDPAPTLVVVQGIDPAAVEKAFALVVAGVTDDAENGGKRGVKRSTFRGVEAMSVGEDAHLARSGATVFFANKEAALHAALTLLAPQPGDTVKPVTSNPTVAAARKLAGDGAAAWGWLDFAAVKATEEAKNFFEATRKDILQTLVIGSSVDAFRRSDFVAFGLHPSAAGYAVTVRLPARRADLDGAMRIHVPPAGQVGSLPLLTPPGVIYSQSFHLDLGHLWRERKTIFNAQNLKDVEEGVKGIDKVLPGTTFGQLLEQSGPYHRLVAAHTGEKLYAVRPAQVIPPAAVVFSMRDAEYGRTMDGVLRGAALLAGFQTGWTMKEATHDGVKVVTYRFPETGTPKFDDAENLRFNFAPSFAVVGDSLIVGGTPGIVKLLIPELRKESKADGSPVVWRSRTFAAGGADLLLANPEPTVTQTVLTQGVGLDEATKQVRDFVAWLRTAGTLGLSIDHAADVYEIKLDWRFGK